jgi:hypothetical protein
MMTNVPKLIAICGYKRSGKDTLAEYIRMKHGHKHVKIAEKLKAVVKTVFGFTDDQVESDTKEQVDPRWGITPRQAMQFIGTEVFQYKVQELLPDIQRALWIKGLIAEHLNTPNPPPIVISDLRFLHEYEELKPYGVFVIRINRPCCKQYAMLDMHASEREFLDIPFDMEVNNNEQKMEDMFSRIG